MQGIREISLIVEKWESMERGGDVEKKVKMGQVSGKLGPNLIWKMDKVFKDFIDRGGIQRNYWFFEKINFPKKKKF